MPHTEFEFNTSQPTEDNTQVGMQPTEIELFRIPNSEIEEVQWKFDEAEVWRKQTDRANTAHEKLYIDTVTRIDKIEEYAAQITVDAQTYGSSITYDLAYLRLREELVDRRELTEDQFRRHFAFIMGVSNTYYQNLVHLREIEEEPGREPVSKYWKQTNRLALLTDAVSKQLFSRYNNLIPDWFKGTDADWIIFLNNHSFVDTFLCPSDSLYGKSNDHLLPVRKPLPEGIPNGLIFMDQNSTPSWMDGFPHAQIDLAVVENELEEDLERLVELRNSERSLTAQDNHLVDSYNDKLRNVRFYSRAGLLQLFPELSITGDSSITSFTDLVVLLNATKQHNFLCGEEEEVYRMDGNQINAATLESDAFRQRTINTFVDSAMRPELMMVFLEKKLIDADVLKSAQEPISETAPLLKEFFDAHRKPASLSYMRAENNERRKILAYELLPLINDLNPEDDIEFFLELVSAAPEDSTESFLWGVADAICEARDSDYERNTSEAKQYEAVMKEYREFSREWLRANSSWLIEKLEQTLASRQNQTSVTTVQTASSDYRYDPYEDAIDALQTDEHQEEGDPFSEWNIFYAKNKRTDAAHLELIPGGTEDEWSAAFHDYILDNKVPCPHPNKVLMRLRWLVEDALDETEEQIRMREDVKGEVFKKFKLGGIRLYYQVDPEDKTLKFFVYQKERQANIF